MASLFLPDPLQFLRKLINSLESRVNAFANEKMNSEGVARALGGLMQASLVAQQLFESVSGRVLKRLNLPSHAQVSELLSALHRIEAKLDQLAASQPHAALAAPERPRPARTRRAPQATASAASAELNAATTRPAATARKTKRR